MVMELVFIAKLNRLSTSNSLSPIVGSLVWPFLLKLFGFGLIGRTCTDIVYALRLFTFQMGHIAFGAELRGRNSTRWDRALRLIHERVTHARRSPTSQSDEHSLHTLTMLAL
ncbi:hypothetical protein L1049_021815 [Liquidambar formosana]|uniref:Uncharacterized protein n=1 Tax=Liquidambar formosana TaxID=63359 RepID=A0AAP0RBF1_LIQFO